MRFTGVVFSPTDGWTTCDLGHRHWGRAGAAGLLLHRDGEETYDEIIISTLPLGISRWLKLDLISKARAVGLPVTHVQAPTKAPAGVSST